MGNHPTRPRAASTGGELPATPRRRLFSTSRSPAVAPTVNTPVEGERRATTPIHMPATPGFDRSFRCSTPGSVYLNVSHTPFPEPSINRVAQMLEDEAAEESEKDDDFEMPGQLPVIFRWPAKDQEVFLNGSWDNFERNIPLVSMHDDCGVTLKLSPGEYHYRFLVNGTWMIDALQEKDPEDENLNLVSVTERDFDVVRALEDDNDFCERRISESGNEKPVSFGHLSENFTQQALDRVYYENEAEDPPPPLPAQLVGKLIPNRKTSHVRFNRMYAQHLKGGGILALATTTRLHKKTVQCILYVPEDEASSPQPQ